MAEKRDPIRDMAETWEIISRARTTLLNLTDEKLEEHQCALITKVILNLEKAQGYVGDNLAVSGVGIDKMSGSAAMGYPSAMAMNREREGNE